MSPIGISCLCLGLHGLGALLMLFIIIYICHLRTQAADLNEAPPGARRSSNQTDGASPKGKEAGAQSQDSPTPGSPSPRTNAAQKPQGDGGGGRWARCADVLLLTSGIET